jgi:hypothetical protein
MCVETDSDQCLDVILGMCKKWHASRLEVWGVPASNLAELMDESGQDWD